MARNPGFPDHRIVVVTVGGSIRSEATAEEAREVNEEQQADILDPGDLVSHHEPSEDPVLTEGDRMALLVEDSEYRSFDGRREAIRVWAGISGAFVVDPDARLQNPALDKFFPDVVYPKTLEAFERAVSSSS